MELSYKYKEVDRNGKISIGEMKASSKEEVIESIRKKGNSPIKIEELEAKSKDISFGNKVKLRDMAIFCKQLHTMLDAGMPLTNCLDVLSQQTENKRLKAAIRDMYAKVQTGTVLSETMLMHPKIFPPLLITMVQAGEMTGNLDDVLRRMSEHYEKENKIQSKVKGAMIYPMILGLLTVGVVVAMLTFIMPQFVTMFESAGEDLPSLTKGLLHVSNSLRSRWYLYLGGLVSAIYGLKTISATREGKKTFDKFKSKTPLIKTPIKMIATSRFTRTLSTLLASGIPIMNALTAAGNVTNNTIVQEGMVNVVEEIKKGLGISLLLKRMNYFPPMMISMISIGEETGELEGMLSKTADYYDEELDSNIQKLLSTLEPVLILVMGGLIGTIVVAIMMPILNLASTIK